MSNVAYLDYDMLSEGYDELYGGEQRAKHHHAVDRVREAVSRVCDAGCGTALLLETIRARLGPVEYVGFDTAANMLAKALLRADAFTHLVQADANHMPFRGKVFSHLFCLTVIHHLKPQQFIQEAQRTTTTKIIISQHKRLTPRLTDYPVEENETVDEIITISIHL
ncbi:MAG: class I SAM-dependent methyltransferase [Candidatus Caldarchaeum sp.]|nr:class I SAM-dependent methyltransferase [Candidatus Caldarchaeales archaeon]